jgi:hypothetical protein
MSAETPKKSVSGVLLPVDGPLRMRTVVEGLYVAEDDPYTDRYDYFESSRLYRRESQQPARIRAGAPATRRGL